MNDCSPDDGDLGPELYDHPVWQGNDSPLIVEISSENGFDGTGSDFVLTIAYKTDVVIYRSSTGGLIMDIVTDPATGIKATIVTWQCTPAMSRLLPIGRLAQYELERQVSGGEQKTLLAGYMDVHRGQNVD